MRIQKITTIAALAFFLAVAGRAADEPYLRPETAPKAVAVLPAPPEPNSAEAIADADEAYRVYSTRTPEQLALGKDENDLTVFHFSPAIGPWFQPGRFPKTEALFKKIEAEARSATDAGKRVFKRVRPYNADPKRFSEPIEHEAMTSYSYPSGHATRGMLFALVLSELFPDRHEALLLKGREAGWLRVQGGVHYPLDVYAGRVWGLALSRAFLSSPALQHDLEAAKAELAGAVKTAEPAVAH